MFKIFTLTIEGTRKKGMGEFRVDCHWEFGMYKFSRDELGLKVSFGFLDSKVEFIPIGLAKRSLSFH